MTKRITLGVILILLTQPVAAACKRYSVWRYPYPQRCGAAHQDNEPIWYMEITKLPNGVAEETALDKLREQLSSLKGQK